jgi:hypothetical protein
MHITHNPHIAPVSIDIHAEIAAIRVKQQFLFLNRHLLANILIN